MKSTIWICAILALGIAIAPAQAAPGLIGMIGSRRELDKQNRRLCGQVLDFTDNHGSDNRIWSPALCQKRDVYVYLPPCYDPAKKYPLIIWLHSFRQDEYTFLTEVIGPLDQAMACGQLPASIIIAPDGTINGRRTFLTAGSFFINSNAGNFENFIIQDIWNFAFQNFPIRPEREAHALVGASMGGFGAYNLGIKHRDMFKIVVGIFPPLNLRWLDCHCNYKANFDPCCWGWRTQLRPHEVIARFYCVIPVRLRQLTDVLFGRGPDVIARIAQENPIEMLEAFNVRPGELDMYIGYGGKDQFNIDAQVESFLYVARQRGLEIAVDLVPNGKHDVRTAKKLMPCAINWLAPRLAPYSPP